MKSDKLNKLLSSCNKLETLDCYYWKDYVIGEKYEIDYKSLREEVLNEIATNLFSLQPNQANLYFHQLFQTFENVVENKDWKHNPTFSNEAKEEYEFQLAELRYDYLNAENSDEDIDYLLCNSFEEILKEIIKLRFRKRLVLIESLKSKVEEIKSIYFNIKFEQDKINLDNSNNNETSINKDNNESDELNEIISLAINDRIKWKGKPSQFGFFVLELIGKGWIELPTKSHNKSAEFLLKLFDVDTSKGNLSKEINIDRNSLTIDSQGIFKIKHNQKK